eukprot:364899-Chlamydomonas_euryale.AAC.11
MWNPYRSCGISCEDRTSIRTRVPPPHHPASHCQGSATGQSGLGICSRPSTIGCELASLLAACRGASAPVTLRDNVAFFQPTTAWRAQLFRSESAGTTGEMAVDTRQLQQRGRSTAAAVRGCGGRRRRAHCANVVRSDPCCRVRHTRTAGVVYRKYLASRALHCSSPALQARILKQDPARCSHLICVAVAVAGNVAKRAAALRCVGTAASALRLLQSSPLPGGDSDLCAVPTFTRVHGAVFDPHSLGARTHGQREPVGSGSWEKRGWIRLQAVLATRCMRLEATLSTPLATPASLYVLLHGLSWIPIVTDRSV